MDNSITDRNFYIVVGCFVFVVVLLVIAIIVVCCRRQKERKKIKDSEEAKKQHVQVPQSLKFVYNTNIEEQQTEIVNDDSTFVPSLEWDETNPNGSPYSIVQPSDPITRVNNGRHGAPLPSQSISVTNDSGKLSTSLFYDCTLEKLRVTIVQWYNSDTINSRGRLSPYVKLCLLPDNETKYFTKTKIGENPIFDEEFSFPVSHGELQDKNLHFSVCDFDRFSRQSILGNAVLSLDGLLESLTQQGGTGEIWVELSEHNELQPTHNKGGILYSLAYFPTAGRITLTVIKAKELNIEQDDTGLDVKVNLLFDGKVEKFIRTSLLRTSLLKPVFNEQYIFDTPSSLLDQTSFEILVYAYKDNKRRIIGKVMAGPYLHSNGTGLAHWKEMLQKPRTSVSYWHKLL